MDCERFRELLDAYIDGALNEEQLCQFMDHAHACEACREEMRAAEMLRDMMKDMDDGVAVPLAAQAAWRNAVRAEAKKLRMRRVMRAAYAAAAALILVVGCTVAMDAFNGTEVVPEAQPLMMTRAVTSELIAKDGSEQAARTVSMGSVYSAVKKYAAADYDEACRTLSLLCEEYSGALALNVSEVSGARVAEYRIELPGEYLQDFLNAVSRLGTELASESGDVQAETAVVLIQICEE